MMNKKKLSALVLAGTMMFGMVTNVFAAAGTTPPDLNQNGSASITKEFEMSEGLTVPAYTFNFTAEPKSPQDAPKATITPITYGTDNGTDSGKDGKHIFTKDATITFGTFPHAGEYVYTVTENSGTDTGVTYSKDAYELHVYVKNGQNGPEVDMITAKKGADKVEKMVFTNTYEKAASLKITKVTKSNQADGKDFADKTKRFAFTITFTKAATADALGEINGTITRKATGQQEPVSCKNGAADFELADGDTLVFNNLPVGTTYEVIEKSAKDGYTPSVKVVENGQNTTDAQGQETGDLSSKNQGKQNLVGEKDNSVTFTNTYRDIAITGIVMNNLPFILLVGVAVVAFAALAVMKKHRTSER